MNHTLKHIRLAYILILFISIPFSNLMAVDVFKDLLVIDQNSILIENTKKQLQKCKESKSKNFTDRTPTKRMILIYLNSLLDKILYSNERILEKFNRSKEEFCVDIGYIKDASFVSLGFGLIQVDLKWAYDELQRYKLSDDSKVTALLSHKLSHDLLFHFLEALETQVKIYDTSSFKEKYKDINEYNFDERLLTEDKEEFIRITEILEEADDSEEQLIEYNRALANTDKLRKEYKEWNEFYPSDSTYVKLRQSQEIDADNLGLLIYLNTGLKPESYGWQYIASEYHYNNTKLYPSIPDVFRKLSMTTFITAGQSAIKEKRFQEFMDSIKYIDPLAYQPSDFWRYWNAMSKMESYKIDLYRGTTSTLYLHLDLSQDERLEDLKKFFSKKDNLLTPIKNKKDLRYYLISKLFSSNPESINYTLEFSYLDRGDVGMMQDNNTIILRGSGIFRLALAKRNYSVIEKNLLLLEKNLDQHTTDCTELFTYIDLYLLRKKPYKKVMDYIQRAFY